VQRIGLDGVRALALAMELYSRLPTTKQFREERDRCLRIASVAAAICTEDSEHAYLCALLHDLGTLTLRSLDHVRVARCADLRAKGELSIVEIERAEFGIDHAALGAEILELFEMSDIADVVRHHHLPSGAGRPPRIDALAALHIAEATYDQSVGLPLDIDLAFLDSLGPLAEMTLFRARRLVTS